MLTVALCASSGAGQRAVAPAAQPEPAPADANGPRGARDAQGEIGQLLKAIETSNCQFCRNGSWYDAAGAAAHLRDKYRLLAARKPAARADEFIDEAGTRSSTTGEEYLIRCPGDTARKSADWSKARLSAFRADKSQKLESAGGIVDVRERRAVWAAIPKPVMF